MPGGTVEDRRKRRRRSRTRAGGRPAGMSGLRWTAAAVGVGSVAGGAPTGMVGAASATPGPVRGLDRTHVLIGADCLLRRRDLAEMIGLALAAKAAGVGHRRAAVLVGVPVSTARGWLRRFALNAEAIRVWFTVLAHGRTRCWRLSCRRERRSVMRRKRSAWRRGRRRCGLPRCRRGRSRHRPLRGGCFPTRVGPVRRLFERSVSGPFAPRGAWRPYG